LISEPIHVSDYPGLCKSVDFRQTLFRLLDIYIGHKDVQTGFAIAEASVYRLFA